MIDQIQEYINNLEGIKKEWVLNIVAYMDDKDVVKETFGYKMPTYKGDDFYIAFAAQKNYFSFYTDKISELESIKVSIPSVSLGKNCARIKYKEQGTIEVIKNIIDLIVDDNNEYKIG